MFHLLAEGSGDGTWSRGELAPLALAVAGVIVLVVFSRRWMRGSARAAQTGAHDRPRELPDRQSGLHDRRRGERELGELMIELDQLAREVHGRLDTQFAKLETVIRDADDRIDRLKRLLRASRSESALDITVTDDAEIPSSTASSEPEGGLHADVYRLADAGRSLLEISEQTGRPKGELELILALRRARQRSAAASIASGA